MCNNYCRIYVASSAMATFGRVCTSYQRPVGLKTYRKATFGIADRECETRDVHELKGSSSAWGSLYVLTEGVYHKPLEVVF